MAAWGRKPGLDVEVAKFEDWDPAGRTLRSISRKASASPAVGSAKVHEVEQRELVARAFRD